jgi:chromosomal replication initiator protein
LSDTHHSSSAPDEQLQAVWQQVLACLSATLNNATYNLAFSNTRATRLDGDRIVLAVETEFARSWVAQRYQAVLKDALYEVLGTDIAVEVVVVPAETGDGLPGQPAAQTAAAPAQRMIPTIGRVHGRLQDRFVFENFVTGPSNRFAHAAALAVAEQPAQSFNPFFIYGGVGLGKTHLLQAIGHFVVGNHPALTVRYVSVETFTNDFITALGEGGTQAFKERYRGVDVLLIDDIQMLEGKDQTQEEFFHTFNDLHEAGKQIVISSDRPPKAMATLEARLRSRFEMGLITDVQPPDLETRIAILRKKVHAGGYQIHDPEVLPFIAARLQDNVRELEGALIRVVAQASHAKAHVTVDLAREVLRAYFPTNGASISVEAIQEEVCRHYGLSIAELVGDKRDKRVVVPRQVAMYLSRELTQSSLPALGRAFGGRDHTTVMYAVNKVGNQMSDEGEIFAAVQSLTHRLKNHV